MTAGRGQSGRRLSLGMAGCRALSPLEQRKLLRVVRKLPARDRALITTMLMTGFRVSEVLSLRVRLVFHKGDLAEQIAVAPRNLKGGYGRTRRVPIVPELRCALERHLGVMRKRYELSADLPLFLSRQGDPEGLPRPLSRESARTIVHRVFRRAGINDDGQLGTHVFRKTWARNVYDSTNHDIHLLSAALSHSDISTTQKYLTANEDELMRAMRSCDFTRRPRPQLKLLNGSPQGSVKTKHRDVA